MDCTIVADEYPLDLLKNWLEKAKQTYESRGLIYPEAATLSTVSPDNTPNARIVLIKSCRSSGLTFFTNLGSVKSCEITQNDNVCLSFYWGILERQVKIKGKATLVSDLEADDYFKTRPRDSNIGAWASYQSKELSDRRILEERVEEFNKKFPHDVPRPEFWSGFKVIPTYFEFWQAEEFRLHHRQIYSKVKNGYKKQLLYP